MKKHKFLFIIFVFFQLLGAQSVYLQWDKKEADIWQITRKASQDVSLFYWKPEKYASNFGDALSPLIVERIIGEKLIQDASKQKFLALGSILHFAKNNTLIWGTGRNGKIPVESHRFSQLDVRAVRGPLTRKFLLSKGIACPEVYGDPALLMPLLFPELQPEPEQDYIIIPHINEMGTVKNHPNIVLPIEDCMKVVKKILQAKLVISSSLHGIIVAEAFGIPARLLRMTDKENIFKYQDYYYATGRPHFNIATSIEQALQMGGEPAPKIDLQKLLNAFPYDKFNQ